jgi:hypothetical protein
MTSQSHRPETLALHAGWHIDDIIADIERGLAAAGHIAKAA